MEHSQSTGSRLHSASNRRVVITGLGAITPLGHNWPASWRAMLQGECGAHPITHFDPTDFPTRIVAAVPGWNPAQYMNSREARRLGKVTQFAWAAAQEAVRDAEIDLSHEDPFRVGVEIGSAFGAMDVLEEQSHVLSERGPRRINPTVAPAVLISTTPCYIAIEMGIQGPVNSQVTACATGITAVGEAVRRIQRGEADVMIAGGSESYITPLIMAAFSRLGAMSTRNDDPRQACRPFDLQRDGMVIGEGAGVLVLESLEHAQARGARILGEFGGYNLTCDAYHLAAPQPEGRGATAAMRVALAESGLQAEDLGYICAHGTGTQLNDKTETLAIKYALGETAYQIPVSSLKAMVGHMMGAAGSISILAMVQALQDDALPPTINYSEPDPECDLDYIPNEMRPAHIDAAMCNAFGFGGQNASLIVKRFGANGVNGKPS